MTTTAEGAPRRGRPPTSEARRREQRLEIARHAVRLFRAHGVAGTTGRDIAVAAGVSERTLWRWFATKESCVEPLLARSTEQFAEVARSWPEGRDLPEHLEVSYGFLDESSRDDVDALLAILRMAREEPALRAIWLLLSERAESAFAEVLAARSGLAVDSLEIQVRAATTNAALRVANEDLARAAAGGLTDALARRYRVQLAAALRLATPSP